MCANPTEKSPLLLDCPFCGSKAQLRDSLQGTWKGEARTFAAVRCPNLLCPVQPETKCSPGDPTGQRDIWATPAQAIAEWNRRRDRSRCPNCDRPAPGGLYSTPPRGSGAYTVSHCGCYYEPKGGERYTQNNDGSSNIRDTDPHDD